MLVTVLVGVGAVDVRDVNVPFVRLDGGCDSAAIFVTVVPPVVIVVVLGARAVGVTNNVAPAVKEVVIIMVPLGVTGTVNVSISFVARVTLTAAILSSDIECQRASYECIHERSGIRKPQGSKALPFGSYVFTDR